MTFYDALAAMKMGFAVRRRAWRSGAWRSLVDGTIVLVRSDGSPLAQHVFRREVYIRVADFEGDDWEIGPDQPDPAELAAPTPEPAEC